MDPTELLTQIVDLLNELEEEIDVRGETCEKLEDLVGWLRAGGFPPQVHTALENAGYAPIE